MRYLITAQGEGRRGGSLTAFTTPSIHLILRHARQAAKLTQAEVARRMGTTQSAISRAESLAGPDPTVRFLERFAAATGQTLSPIIGVSERPVAMQPSEVLAEAQRLRRLARRAGCAWISALPPTRPQEVQIVVRRRERKAEDDDHWQDVLSLATRRAFARQPTVIDLDTVRNWTRRGEFFRSRHTLASVLRLSYD